MNKLDSLKVDSVVFIEAGNMSMTQFNTKNDSGIQLFGDLT